MYIYMDIKAKISKMTLLYIYSFSRSKKTSNKKPNDDNKTKQNEKTTKYNKHTKKVKGKMTYCSNKMSLLQLLVLVLLVQHCNGSIQNVRMILHPNDEYVMYMVTYINGPGGNINLQQLSFQQQNQQLSPIDNATTVGTPETRQLTAGKTAISRTNILNKHTNNNNNQLYDFNNDTEQQKMQQQQQQYTQHILRQQQQQQKMQQIHRSLQSDMTTNVPISSSPVQSPIEIPVEIPIETPVDTVPVVSSSVPTMIPISTTPITNQENDNGSSSSTNTNTNTNAITNTNTDTIVDIVIFSLPTDCSKDPTKQSLCDYSQLGVGQRYVGPTVTYNIENTNNKTKSINNNELRWCCSKETIQLHMCDQSQYGRLLIDRTKLFSTGSTHIEVIVPPPQEATVRQSSPADNNKQQEQNIIFIDRLVSNITITDTNMYYMILFSNCYSESKSSIVVHGETIITSKYNSYLPGGFIGYINFYTIISIIYSILFIWYSILFYLYSTSNNSNSNKQGCFRCYTGSNNTTSNEVSIWIYYIIILGLCEVCFRTIDYSYWNDNGYRIMFMVWCSIFFDVIKAGVVRSLLVLLSLGRGIIPNVQIQYKYYIYCILLGIVYIIIKAIIDSIVLVATIEVYLPLSDNNYIPNVYDIVKTLYRIQVLLNVVFIIWIGTSLLKTIIQLKKLSSSSSTTRETATRSPLPSSPGGFDVQLSINKTITLLKFFVITVLISIIITIISWVDSVEQNYNALIALQHTWIKDGAIECTTLFLLIIISILWRPTPTVATGTAQYDSLFLNNDTLDDDDGTNNIAIELSTKTTKTSTSTTPRIV